MHMLTVAFPHIPALAFAMPAAPTTSSSAAQSRDMGRALKLLRERSGLTQDAAAARMRVTKTAWQNYENGRAIVLRSDFQQRAAAALGHDVEALMATLREVSGHPPPAPVIGVAEPTSPFMQQAIFPLREGDVTVSYPANLSPQGFQELRDYLDLFLRRAQSPNPS